MMIWSVWSELCGTVWWSTMVGYWRLAPEGNDNVRRVNIESNFSLD